MFISINFTRKRERKRERGRERERKRERGRWFWFYPGFYLTLDFTLPWKCNYFSNFQASDQKLLLQNVSHLILKMFVILSKELKIYFQNRKWNNPNRKWNYFSNFQVSYQKTSFSTSFSYDPMGSKLIFITGNRKSKTREKELRKKERKVRGKEIRGDQAITQQFSSKTLF